MTTTHNTAVILRLEREVESLRSQLESQRKAAISGIDAAKRSASVMERNAKQLASESSPEALESEREANAMLTEEVEQERKSRQDAQILLTNAQEEQALYGRMIAAALNGKRHPKEPDNDGRLNAIRAMVAGLDMVRDKYRTEQSLRAQAERHCDNLVADPAEVQRLYERATRRAMEAQRRADRLEGNS